jgi:hypothetical protein
MGEMRTGNQLNIKAIKEKPGLAKFKFRAKNKWLNRIPPGG